MGSAEISSILEPLALQDGGSLPWMETLVFDNSDPAFPVELFLQLMERQIGIQDIQSDLQKCLITLNNLPSEADSSVTQFKHALISKIDSVSWKGLKSQLLDSFGRKRTCSVNDLFSLLRSLVKSDQEDGGNFLLRVKFAVAAIEQGKLSSDPAAIRNDWWVKLLLLNGLSETERDFAIPKLNGGLSLDTLVDLLNVDTKPDLFGDETAPSSVKLEVQDDEDVKPVFPGKSQGYTEDSSEEESERKSTKCSRCGKVFESKAKLNSHVMCEHSLDYKCQICHKKFASIRDRKNHYKQMHNGKRVECPICHKQLMQQKTLDNHIKVVHESGVKISPWMVSTRKSLYNFTASSNDGSIEVNNPLKNLYTQVIKSSDGGKSIYICALCKEQFVGRKEFTEHSKTVHNGQIAKCDCCDYASISMNRVARHRLAQHDMITPGYDVFHCDQEGCNFKAITKKLIAAHHASVHEKLRQFSCNLCDKSVSTKGALKLHVENVHMGMRRYSCEVCGQTFKGKTHQLDHMNRLHSEKPPERHVCEECGDSFGNLYTLKMHLLRTHRQQKNVECSTCGKRFFNSTLLLHHNRAVHQMYKKYICPHCDKGFRNNADAKKHIASFHLKIKSYRCKICNSFYAKGCNLCYHIGVHHMGFSQEESRKKCSLAKKHEAYEYTKPDESHFAAYNFK